MEREIWPSFPEISSSSLRMRFGILDWMMHGWTRAKYLIQALRNEPESFNLSAFDSVLTLIVSLVPGNDFAGAELLYVSSLTCLSAPSNEVVMINPVEESIQYLPETGFVGSNSFNYQVCDSSSPTPLCNTASVTIVVQPLAGAGIQYRLVTIDYDILGNAIAAMVQTRTAAASKLANVQLDVANSTGVLAVLSGPKAWQC